MIVPPCVWRFFSVAVVVLDAVERERNVSVNRGKCVCSREKYVCGEDKYAVEIKHVAQEKYSVERNMSSKKLPYHTCYTVSKMA